MHISVVIPTYNRAETLVYVLPSLLEQSYPDFELLLCDSRSQDGTAALVEQLNDARIKYLPGDYRGRGEARNAGLKQAKGDLVLFTDADIIADKDLLAEHYGFHRRYPGLAVVGCELQVNSYQEYLEQLNNLETRKPLHPPQRKKLTWLYFLTGNASAARQTLLTVGGFDDNFTGYGHEDLELGYRLQKAGLSIRYNPAAINFHLHPVAFPEKCEKMKLAGISTVRFYQKHRDPAIKLALGWNPAAFLWYRIFKTGLIKWLEKKSNKGRTAQEIILQYHYLSGIKQALKEGVS